MVKCFRDIDNLEWNYIIVTLRNCHDIERNTFAFYKSHEEEENRVGQIMDEDEHERDWMLLVQREVNEFAHRLANEAEPDDVFEGGEADHRANAARNFDDEEW